MKSVCVAVLERRSARRGAKGDAGTSVERRNEAVAHENATRMGRTLFARGFVEALVRITRYALRASPARGAKIAPAQTIPPGFIPLPLKRFLIIPIAIAAAITAGAAPAPDFNFVGNWYGVGEPDDPSISYIDSYSPDGTFHSEFRKCEGTQVVWHQTETGKWSVTDGVLRMISDTIDGKPDRFDNSYQVEFAQPDEFRARLAQPDFLFVEKRIPKFEFPPCYVGS